MTQAPDLRSTLTVSPAGRTRDDLFEGPAMPTPHGRSFGGQVLAQAIVAAGATVDEDRAMHSMHGYFLRPGDASQPQTIEVSRLHDGRSFSTRRAQAYQQGETTMSLIASFQSDDDGFEHHEPYDMTGVPAPDDLPSVWEAYGHLAASGRASWVLDRPFDFRYVESDILLSVDEPAATQRVWLRSREAFEGTRLQHSAALAFASDYVLIEPVMRRAGVPWATPGMRSASLDHSMWFHREFRVDEWLLYELHTPTAQGGRGLTHGKFYRADGVHVASVAQESMVRFPDA